MNRKTFDELPSLNKRVFWRLICKRLRIHLTCDQAFLYRRLDYILLVQLTRLVVGHRHYSRWVLIDNIGWGHLCWSLDACFFFLLWGVYNLSHCRIVKSFKIIYGNQIALSFLTVEDGSDIKTLLESYDVLQKVTRLLEKETPQNWQVFAQKFGVSKEECDYLCPEDCHSPTEALMEYLSAADEKLTLQTFIQALLYIPREDVVESLKKFFNPIGEIFWHLLS